MTTYLITFGAFLFAMVLAQVLAQVLTGVARSLALRWHVMSHVTERSSHTQPTPRLGGLGLAAGFGGAAALFLLTVAALPRIVVALHGGDAAAVDWTDPGSQVILGFLPRIVGWGAAGWLLMLLVGLADDVADLPPVGKLAGMTLAALAPILGAGVALAPAQALWMPTWLHGALGIVFALGWILFFTNGYNFMDGMDGFAATFARTAALAMFAVIMVDAWRYDLFDLLRAEIFLLPLLAMACWGFLHWNHPPARVFMGDGGSLSTGYVLALFPLVGQQGRLGLLLPWIASLTILLPFVFDVVLTLVRRLHRGENILRAHREHLYQRLMQTGLTHAQVLAINRRRFYACALLAVVGHWYGGSAAWIAFAAALALMLQYWHLTHRMERRTVTNADRPR